MEGTIKAVTQNLCFGGVQSVYTHQSRETGCTMRFGVYLPPQAKSQRVPILYWLSGLTCTEENFIVKAGAQRIAAALGLAIVVPDTSPRGLQIPGEGDSYDFGLGGLERLLELRDTSLEIRDLLEQHIGSRLSQVSEQRFRHSPCPFQILPVRRAGRRCLVPWSSVFDVLLRRFRSGGR